MTTLNSVLAPSRITYREGEWSTTIKRWPNGRSTKKRDWASPLQNFEVIFDSITLTQLAALAAFFDAQSGQFGTFQFIDTHTGVTYNVEFIGDKLRRENVHENVRGLYNVTVQLQETR